MKTGDVSSVADLHLASFPGFFLSFLGRRFLSVFYAGVCSSPDGIAFVAVDGHGDAQGFVAGSCNPRGFYTRLLRRDWLRFCLASVGAVCRRPSVIARLARAVLHPRDNPVGDDVAGLFSIGVSPAVQGKGIGALLVREFMGAARLRGCKTVFLTTDRDDNEAVNGFYGRLGFAISRQYVTPEGRNMNEYRIDLS